MDKASLRYLKSHEWVAVQGDTATVGISEFAVKQLTDLTYVDLPAVGATVTMAERFGEVESVKAVSDLYSPVTGEVVETNTALDDDVAPLSDDPLGGGWLMKVRVTDPAGMQSLLTAAEYQAHCDSQSP